MSERDRTIRRVIGLSLLTALIGSSAWAVHWATAEGPPLGDSRACQGTDRPLEQALAATGLVLPPDASDVHYLAHRNPATARLELSVAFHSARNAMTTFLVQHGLTADQVADLDNGPYVRGDVTEIPGLCGNTAKPPAVLVPLTTGTDPRPAQVAVETDGRTIRPRTAVVLTLSPR